MSAAAVSVGWFRDPYARHEDRYFSEGRPTQLVRDGGLEAVDPPPDLPFPVPPVPALSPAGVSPDEAPPAAAGLRRADDAQRGSVYDRRSPCELATSAMVQFGGAR